MRLIDADVFLLELTHWKGTDGNYHENSQTFYTLDEVMDAIEEADVEAEPVKRGRWKACDLEKWATGVFALRCSECGGGYHLNFEHATGTWKFCPICGARMEEET